MNGKDIEKERKEAYNRFAKHYNNNSGLSTFAELTTIQQGLEKNVGELGKKLRKYYDSLKEKLEDGYNESQKKACREAKNHIQKKLERETKLGFHIQSPELMQKELLNKATDFFNKYSDESKAALNIKMFSGTLNLFLSHSQKLQHRGNHLSAIRNVNRKIMDANYPTQTPLFEDLSEIEKTEYQREQNEFEKKLIKEGKQNEPKRQEVYKEARKIIGKDSVSKYFTKKGWPISKLHSPIARRTEYPQSTVKDWLKKAYKRKDNALFNKLANGQPMDS